MEQWLPIPGYEGAYEVSDLGRVRSLDRVLTSPEAKRGYPKRLRGRIIKLQRHSRGYLQAGLSQSDIHLVQRLVLAAFVGPQPEGQEACHNDGDKTNNKLTNIRWDTHLANIQDRIVHGTSTEGEKNGQAVLTTSDVKFIRFSRLTPATLSARFGITKNHVSRVRHRGRWAHVA